MLTLLVHIWRLPNFQHGASDSNWRIFDIMWQQNRSKTVLGMKIHKFSYFPKIETYGKESAVNVQHSETVKRVLRMLLQLLFFW